jgi:hypothetical protein
MSEQDTAAQFKEMTDNIFAEDADRILDRHIQRVENWHHNRTLDGLDSSLYDLTKKLAAEEVNKKTLVVMLSAALWRLADFEAKGHG